MMPSHECAARIDGQPAPLAAAVARAAAILGGSRNAVVAGLATDIAGIEAAVALAQRIGGTVDHVHGHAALRDLEVMRRDGWLVTTPLQARARADLLLLLGPGIARVWPGFAARLAPGSPPALAPERPRRVVLIGVDAATAAHLRADEALDVPVAELAATLGLLRALAAGRPVRPGHPQHAAALRCAALLGEARYGVAVWTGDAPALAIEVAVGLIEDRNRHARFAGLPLGAGPGNAEGAVQAAAWRTGYPPPTSFARGVPEHDPWRCSARRMVESGEADAALWVAPGVPDWLFRVPGIALVADPARVATPPAVCITVAEPGVQHDAALHDPDLGTLAWRRASRPDATPSAATVLRQIAAALPC